MSEREAKGKRKAKIFSSREKKRKSATAPSLFPPSQKKGFLQIKTTPIETPGLNPQNEIS